MLADFGNLALRSDKLDEVLTEACFLVSQALGATRAKILEIEPEGQTLLVRAGVGWKPDIVGKLRLPLGEHSSETFSIKLGEPVVTQDVRRENRFEVPTFLKDAGVVALVNVPILLPGGKAYGLLQVDATEPRSFGEEDTEFLRTYATILGPVIDRLDKVRKLKTAEEGFRALPTLVPALLWHVDASGQEVTLHQGWLDYTGQSDRESQSSGWLAVVHPDDHDTTAQLFADALETKQPLELQHRIRRHDGVYRWFLVRQLPLRDANGRVVQWFGAATDIHDHRLTLDALRESEARLQTLIAGIPELVWRSQDKGMWTWSSPQWQGFTGQSQAQSQALGWLDAVHPEDQEATMSAWEGAKTRGRFDVEFRLKRASDGAWLWHHTHAAPVRDAGGRIVEWLGTSADIEEQARARAVLTRSHDELEALVTERTGELMAAEEALRQAQKMEAVGQLTGGLAHDFNNMLQGVSGGLDMARRRMAQKKTEEALRYLDAARDAAGRAAGLTRRLLAFARRQRLDPRPVGANGLVAGLADLIRHTMGPGIGVELRLRDGIDSVLCDSSELENALLNLCINARDAMPDGGRLVVGTEDVQLAAADIPDGEAAPGRYVAISVTDTGTGMSPEVLRHAFEPFFTTKPQGQGTGLGLSQIYGFVRQSGGLVSIRSASGQGTTVRLLLPLHGHVQSPETPKAAPVRDEGGPRRTVLLVDDEVAGRGPVADRLRELGYVVLEAADGPGALRILASARPDLLITDVGLPNGMNGRQVAEAAREQVPGLPVLFISGYAGTALPPGVQVISKPFELDTLTLRIQAILKAGHREKARDPEA
ncbi:PAS domain-containing protein [Belnapia sp. F-4-1]|uniref:PAS domain-containing protein n=1 Tax=Belnapia sp. F-4-1 TaxID=1545443 RepID=UPI001364E12D|nr:PAS domain-containing protein [Belnapia sp. F-4-1]